MTIKTISTVDGINVVDFGNTINEYYWFRNLGDTTIYVSNKEDFKAGDDGVSELTVKGDITNIESFDGKVYILGAGKVEIHNTDSKLPPFKSAPVAGSGGGGSSSSVSGFQIEKYIDERIIGATSVSTLPYELAYGSAVVLNNEIHIFGAGGDEPLHYKFNGTSWERVSTLPYEFYGEAAVVLNNEIHILGGGEDGTPHYKFNGTSWESVSTLPYGLFVGSAVVLNNEIHILGVGGDGTLHYKFNGTSWERVSTLPYGLSDVPAVVLNNEIHILGGGEDGAPHYKFNGTSWESVSTLPYGFWDGSAVVLNNEIHILGGAADGAPHYKFNGTSWESEYILPYEFNGGSAVVLNNEIHILGGRPAPTNHYTVTPDTRHISALIPKGVHILLPDIQKIIYASDNVAIEENNVVCVTETGYVEIIAKLTEFNEAYNGGLVFYW